MTKQAVSICNGCKWYLSSTQLNCVVNLQLHRCPFATFAPFIFQFQVTIIIKIHPSSALVQMIYFYYPTWDSQPTPALNLNNTSHTMHNTVIYNFLYSDACSCQYSKIVLWWPMSLTYTCKYLQVIVIPKKLVSDHSMLAINIDKA